MAGAAAVFYEEDLGEDGDGDFGGHGAGDVQPNWGVDAFKAILRIISGAQIFH